MERTFPLKVTVFRQMSVLATQLTTTAVWIYAFFLVLWTCGR